MREKTDLQTQTYYSDGALSPRELVRLASSHGFRVIAITDHNSIAGIPEAQAEGKRRRITIIPGIELYSRYRGKEFHILGYDFDTSDRHLLQALETIHSKHRSWLYTVVGRLQSMGFVIERSNFSRSHSQLIGFGEIISALYKHLKNRRRIARDLGSQRPDLYDIINTYFGPGCRAYVPLPEKQMPTSRAIHLIRDAGGVAVLAHPGLTLSFREDAVVAAMKKMGLRGIEAVTPHHTWHQVVHYQELARDLRLFVTAGSDFHGPTSDRNFVAQTRWDYFSPMQSIPWKRR
jgi:predicted metal-dependent phosphoesterase TrpH